MDWRTEEAISRVTESRHDVTNVIEFLVERRGDDAYVGMVLSDVIESRLGDDETKHRDLSGASSAKHVEHADK